MLIKKEVSVNKLHTKTIQEMCMKLDIKSAILCDYREFAAEINMPLDQIDLISQKAADYAEEVFRWLRAKTTAGVKDLQIILQNMKRDDVLEILNSDPAVKDRKWNETN